MNSLKLWNKNRIVRRDIKNLLKKLAKKEWINVYREPQLVYRRG